MSVSITSGLYYIVKKFGENDYMLGIAEDPMDINEGCSIRGMKEQILKDFDKEDEEKEFIKMLFDFEWEEMIMNECAKCKLCEKTGKVLECKCGDDYIVEHYFEDCRPGCPLFDVEE